MAKTRLAAGLLAALVVLGCAAGFKQKDKEVPGERQPTYVEHVEAPEQVSAGQPLTLVVTGSLPTPAWQITDVSFRKDGRHVLVTVWSELKNHNPTIEMIVPFKRTIEIPGLSAGHWVVEVRGHGETGDKVEVEVR
jgi:hypothetical protein